MQPDLKILLKKNRRDQNYLEIGICKTDKTSRIIHVN